MDKKRNERERERRKGRRVETKAGEDENNRREKGGISSAELLRFVGTSNDHPTNLLNG